MAHSSQTSKNMNPDQPDSLILDVRDRLARIEVKIDNTNEKLKDHDTRIAANADDIADLKREVVAAHAKVGTLAKTLAALGGLGAVVAWFIDHAGAVAAVATAVPR